MYERTLMAGWGDMDFNSHMRNTAYLDKSADLRMMYFGWLDLAQRKLVCPPDALLQALKDADRSEDFQMLPNSRR